MSVTVHACRRLNSHCTGLLSPAIVAPAIVPVTAPVVVAAPGVCGGIGVAAAAAAAAEGCASATASVAAATRPNTAAESTPNATSPVQQSTLYVPAKVTKLPVIWTRHVTLRLCRSRRP